MLAMVYDHSGDAVVGTGLVLALQQLETLNAIFDWLTHTLLVFVLSLIKGLGGGEGSSGVCQLLE